MWQFLTKFVSICKGPPRPSVTLFLGENPLGESRSFFISSMQEAIFLIKEDIKRWPKFLTKCEDWKMCFDELWICGDIGQNALLDFYAKHSVNLVDILLTIPVRGVSSQAFVGEASLVVSATNEFLEDRENIVTINGELWGNRSFTRL